MAVILGSGEYRYRIVEAWARLPASWPSSDGDAPRPAWLRSLQKLERVASQA